MKRTIGLVFLLSSFLMAGRYYLMPSDEWLYYNAPYWWDDRPIEAPPPPPKEDEEEQRLELACIGGDAEVCYQLGRMYERGVGLMANPKKSSYFYGMACKRGIMEACERRDYGNKMGKFRW